MNTITPICRCDNRQRFSGGCQVCNPIDIKCRWDDEYFTVERDGSVTLYTNAEAQYLLEQLILRFQPWNNAG